MKTRYILEVLIAIDQLLNAILGGWYDETISSRAYRKSLDHSYSGLAWRYVKVVIDFVFFWQIEHCKHSFINHSKRVKVPYADR